MIRKAEIRKTHLRGVSPPVRDMTATSILNTLDALRHLAKAGGHEAMAASINNAFDTCLATYVAQKEAELAARIRDAQAG